jgi:hypothetical protein
VLNEAGLHRAGPWRIGGAIVAAHAEVAEDLAPLERLLAGFSRDAGAAAEATSWDVVLRRRAPRLLAQSGRRQSALLSGEPYQARLGRHRRFLVDGRLELAIDPLRRRVLCRLAPDGAALLAGESGLILVDAVVERQGQHMVHSALLALPPSLREGGLLLLGESGAGKTTTALALALGGFALGGDDAAILCRTPQGIAAWALPRGLKIHREVAGLLPPLAPHLDQSRAETVQDAAALASLLTLVQPVDRPLQLRALCWLGPRSGGTHEHRRLSPIEILARLASRDLHAPLGRVDGAVEHQLQLFAEAARQVAGFELSLGRDLPGLPAWLADVLVGGS